MLADSDIAERLASREARQERALRRSRLLALGLLLLAAALYVATYLPREADFWILLLRAAGEAGVVGGLADWFAVTALFRRPFGLPIPHTAIIPRNKDRIAEGLAAFVERHFLEPELLKRRLADANAAARLGEWLAESANSRLIADRILDAAPYIIEGFDESEGRVFFRNAFGEQLRAFDAVPLITQALTLLSESRQHQELFDRALRVARRLLKQNEEFIYERVAERSRWWVPRRFDRKLAEAIVEGVEELLADLAQRDHEARLQFDEAVTRLLDRLHRSEGFRAQVDRFKLRMLASREVQEALGTIWDQIRAMLLGAMRDSDSPLRRSLSGSLVVLGQALRADGDAQARLNRRFEALTEAFIVPFRSDIGRFIAEVVRGWDAPTVARRIELEVGRDLQYIRINGTVVGALAGCLLFLVSRLLA